MTTYYIDPAGNNSNAGTSAGAPWLTFAKFLASSSSGDTCVCAAGTYTWATATISTPRTIQSATPGTQVIFDGAGAIVQWTISGGITVTDVKFQNGLSPTDGTAYFVAGAGSCTFTRCTWKSLAIRPLSAQAGLIGYAASVTISANVTFAFNTCLFSDIVGQSDGLRDMWSNRLSTFVTNTPTVAYVFTGCVFYFLTTTNQLNNLFVKHNSALWVMSVAIKNCIIANYTGNTFTYTSATNGATVTSTLSYSDSYNMTTIPSGTGNITGNPLFYDPANGDFNLRPTSPAMNIGTLV